MREKMLLWVFLLISVAVGKAHDLCGGVIQERSGIITSPNFPNGYSHNQVCTWNITAPLNHTVSFQLVDIGLEMCDNCGCDYVRISSILSNGEEKVHGQFCRPADLKRIFISEENHLRIVFRTDGSGSGKGFKANFTVTGEEEDPQKSSKNKNVHWLLNQINERRSLELPRAILALFLAEPEFFAPRNKTFTELRDSLTIRILSQISRNETIRTHDLALYVQALLVTCQDPRDFHGHDVLSELRSRVDASSSYANPFEILALCNAGAEVTARDVERVMAAFDSQHRPFWTDIQAIATMAMQCLSSHVTVDDERVISEMQDELKKRQFRNGTVENLVTTALVVQALGYKNSSVEFFDLPSALDVLVKAQEEDGSWGNSVRNSFYVLPTVSKKSFLDINDKHCPKKTETEEESLARLQEAGGDKFVVQYSVWIGGDVDLGRTWRVRVQSNKTTTFYDILEMVTKLDNRHNVSYQVVDRKPYVRSLLGKEDDPESGIFWFTYVRSTSSQAPPTLVESSPADVRVIPNQELILWYKSNDWNGNGTQGA